MSFILEIEKIKKKYFVSWYDRMVIGIISNNCNIKLLYKIR